MEELPRRYECLCQFRVALTFVLCTAVTAVVQVLPEAPHELVKELSRRYVFLCDFVVPLIAAVLLYCCCTGIA